MRVWSSLAIDSWRPKGGDGILVMSCTGALISYFFFQAEDGIRDSSVTGVQTCALPISPARAPSREGRRAGAAVPAHPPAPPRPRGRRGTAAMKRIAAAVLALAACKATQIGRASCRERV